MNDLLNGNRMMNPMPRKQVFEPSGIRAVVKPLGDNHAPDDLANHCRGNQRQKKLRHELELAHENLLLTYFFTCVCIHRIQSPSLGVGNCAVVSVITATAELFSPVRGLNHFTSGEGGNALSRISIVRSSGT